MDLTDLLNEAKTHNRKQQLEQALISRKDKEYFVMDETDAPFEENNLPYKRTAQDDLFLIKMAEKFNLELDPESELCQLKQSIG